MSDKGSKYTSQVKYQIKHVVEADDELMFL